jgi:hypothetical protein
VVLFLSHPPIGLEQGHLEENRITHSKDEIWSDVKEGELDGI